MCSSDLDDGIVTSAVVAPKRGEGLRDRKRQHKRSVLKGAASFDDKQQLRALQDQESKLRELAYTAEGASKRKEAAMQRAMSRASGVKVKDDIGKLKKSIKRDDKSRTKNRERWQKRVESVRQHQLERQQRRKQNIQEFVARKKDRTGGPVAPRRPGFEGGRS